MGVPSCFLRKEACVTCGADVFTGTLQTMSGPTNVQFGNSQNPISALVRHSGSISDLFAWGNAHLITNVVDQITYSLHERHAHENLARKLLKLKKKNNTLNCLQHSYKKIVERNEVIVNWWESWGGVGWELGMTCTHWCV